MENIKSPQCEDYRYRELNPSNIADCDSMSSSDGADSDSEVSVDDEDDDEAGGTDRAAVPCGLTAASRLRLIVASEEKRRSRLKADAAAVARNQCQSHSQQHPGQKSLSELYKPVNKRTESNCNGST